VNTNVTYRIGYEPHSTLKCVLPFVCLTAILAANLAQAKGADNQLLIDYVSNSPPRESLTETNCVSVDRGAAATNSDTGTHKAQALRNQPTSGDRWEKFETDFAVSDKDPSLVKGSLESAKYELDRTLFGMQEFVQNVQQAISFDRELRTLGRDVCPVSHSGSASIPMSLWDSVEQARFKSDFDVNLIGGRAYLGVRLVLPIGN
jgi:hypothetical protein